MADKNSPFGSGNALSLNERHSIDPARNCPRSFSHSERCDKGISWENRALFCDTMFVICCDATFILIEDTKHLSIGKVPPRIQCRRCSVAHAKAQSRCRFKSNGIALKRRTTMDSVGSRSALPVTGSTPSRGHGTQRTRNNRNLRASSRLQGSF